MFSKIIINSPWYFFLFSFFISFFLAYWLYFRNKKNAETKKNILFGLFLLRFTSTGLICILLLNIFTKQLQNQTENPSILIAVDNSSSIVSASDSSLNSKFVSVALEKFKEKLQNKYAVKTILFGNKTKATDEASDFSEKETDIENLILDLENNYSNQNIGALVLISDGIYNKGANPIYTAERLGYPIYTMALGDTNEIKDVSIQKINHNQISYFGNNFPVEVVVAVKKYFGKELVVSLSQNGVQMAKQIIKVTSENFLSSVNFTLSAEQVGVSNYLASISLLPDEKNTLNNSQSFAIEIIDNRDKILLLANAVHPDISALKDAILNNSTYELDFSFSSNFKKSLKPYSVVIIHSYTNNELSIFNECKNNNIPLWVIAPQSFENGLGIKINSSFNKQNEVEAYYNSSFGLFSMSDDFKRFVNDFPAVKTVFGNYTLGNGIQALLNQKIGAVETENPILFFNEINGLKSSIFLGDGLWRWKMRDFAEHKDNKLFNELISKSIQYLSVKSDKSFFRVTSPKIINENEGLELGAEVYNKSYELVTEPEVTLVLTNSENKKFNYTFGKTSNAYKLNIGILPKGVYRYEAKVKINGELLFKKGSLLVKEIFAEKINTVANHRLLFQLANRTKGKLFYPNELDQLEKEIMENDAIKSITYTKTTTVALIDLKWLLFAILVLLVTEWFLRKRFLSI